MTNVKYKPIPKHGLFKNLVGSKFGRLSVIGYLGRLGANNNWECLCDCGEKCSTSGGNKPETISQRLRRNKWSIEKTLTTGGVF